MTIDRLIVMWSDLDTSLRAGERFGRHIVGHLARGPEGFSFWYDESLPDAEAHGFVRFPSLPDARDEKHPYVARYLFAAFAERIPLKGRADAGRMLREWGVEHDDDQFEVLARSGGIRATDRIELAEFRAADDSLERPLEFRIAGRGYLKQPAPLAIGDLVSLRPEPENKADATALIVDSDGRPAGYVPRQYTRVLGRLLEQQTSLEAHVIRKLVAPDDVGKWVVQVSRRR